VKLHINQKRIIGKIDPKIFGHFLEHFHRQIYGGVYDPASRFADEDGFRTDVLEALRRIRTPIIRWPGGCYVSAYDWHCGVGNPRIPTFDKAWRVEESNEFGTDEFVKLCRKLDCEPYICTNAGSGTAEEMSNWVEYCNLRNMGRFARERIANGYPEPHRVKYWSIGNENWGDWEIGAKTSAEWGRMVCESAKMMLRVDPTIELSAASIADLDWNLDLLRNAGCCLDWVSIHDYWDRSLNGFEGSDYNRVILRTGEDVCGKIDRVRAILTALGVGNRIKIAFDEWNLRGWYHPNLVNIASRESGRCENEEYYRNCVVGPRDMNDVNSLYTMADAVFSASFLNTCIRNCDLVKMACFSPVVNTRGAIFTHKDGIVLRPQYFVFELYANLLKDTAVDLWTEEMPTISGEDYRPGDMQKKEKTVDALDLTATYGNGTYAITAVNKYPDQEQSLEFVVRDTVSEYRLHTVNGLTTDSYNDIGHTEVGVVDSEWLPYTGSVVIPAHSVNVIELR